MHMAKLETKSVVKFIEYEPTECIRINYTGKLTPVLFREEQKIEDVSSAKKLHERVLEFVQDLYDDYYDEQGEEEPESYEIPHYYLKSNTGRIINIIHESAFTSLFKGILDDSSYENLKDGIKLDHFGILPGHDYYLIIENEPEIDRNMSKSNLENKKLKLQIYD